MEIWEFLAIIIVAGIIADVLKHHSRSVTRREINIIQNKLASLEAQVESLWNKLETEKITTSDEEKEVILQKLEEHHWDKANTANALGIDRATLYRKMKHYNIS